MEIPSLSIVEIGARVDAIAARAEVESKAVSITFTEMRMYVSESVGMLRKDMIRRFDAVDKRFAGIEMRLGRVEKRFDGLEKRFDRLELRFDGLEQRFDRLESRFDRLEQRVGDLEKRFEGLEKRFGELEKRFGGFEKRFGVFERQSGRIERKLDRLLNARPAKARRTRRRRGRPRN